MPLMESTKRQKVWISRMPFTIHGNMATGGKERLSCKRCFAKVIILSTMVLNTILNQCLIHRGNKNELFSCYIDGPM